MECMAILNINSFDCFITIFINFTIFLMAIFAMAKLLRG